LRLWHGVQSERIEIFVDAIATEMSMIVRIEVDALAVNFPVKF
jgi:hypothetical protein